MSNVLKEKMNLNGWTSKDIALKIGVNVRTVNMWIHNPPDNIKKFLTALDIIETNESPKQLKTKRVPKRFDIKS